MTIDRHHLLECILWPKGDGTFRKIINTSDRLKELGIYDDYKLTIQIEHGAHSTMHWKFKEGTEYDFFRDKSPMYGRTKEDSTNWKGDSAKPASKYRRALKEYRRNPTEENLATLKEARLIRKEADRFPKANR